MQHQTYPLHLSLHAQLQQHHNLRLLSNVTYHIDPIDDELKRYLKLEVDCDDILKFRRTSNEKFPHLRNLAQIILAVPATSTPSERIFSTTGLILNAKRTTLSPENVGKIQMVHGNHNLLKKV